MRDLDIGCIFFGIIVASPVILAALNSFFHFAN
jgi:hypothetical protein